MILALLVACSPPPDLTAVEGDPPGICTAGGTRAAAIANGVERPSTPDDCAELAALADTLALYAPQLALDAHLYVAARGCPTREWEAHIVRLLEWAPDQDEDEDVDLDEVCFRPEGAWACPDAHLRAAWLAVDRCPTAAARWAASILEQHGPEPTDGVTYAALLIRDQCPAPPPRAR